MQFRIFERAFLSQPRRSRESILSQDYASDDVADIVYVSRQYSRVSAMVSTRFNEVRSIACDCALRSFGARCASVRWAALFSLLLSLGFSISIFAADAVDTAVIASERVASAPVGNISARPNIVMIFADDWGYGDLGVFDRLDDIQTPNLDRLAAAGVLFTDAYVTAPQCSPSRAGLMTGRYQQRFGFDTIPDCPLPLSETTIATRLQQTGYTTGMVGKWHLDPNALSVEWAQKHQPDGIVNGRVRVQRDVAMPYWVQNRGFTEFFEGELRMFWCNFDLRGNDLSPGGQWTEDRRFRVDVQNDAAMAFLRRQVKTEKPFFLYFAPYAPHVPLEATQKHLRRFPGPMPERRRTGLAMMAAVDEGVGRIVRLLEDHQLLKDTLIMFTSDNGAPLGAHTGRIMDDVLPVAKPGPAWDGSRNDPLTGEKGMLAEGGIRVPMVWFWPAGLPAGRVVSEPVISLDMTATAAAVGGVSANADELDGENLIPLLTDEGVKSLDRSLYWRFWNQAAVRRGDWKLLVTSDLPDMLFHIRDDIDESHDVRETRPGIAKDLRRELQAWTDELKPAGVPKSMMNDQEDRWYRYYFPEAAKAPQ